ncbi:MAG: hypothetical protein ACO3UU_14030 [Minisyncoccia bacterium]
MLRLTKFTVPITTPCGRDVRIEGITNREYQEIIKYCSINDYEGLESLFETLVFSKIPFKLNCIDKFYILIALRIFFIDESITILSDGKEITLSLYNVLSNLDKIEIENKTYNVDEIQLELGYPDNLYYTDIDSYLDSIIVSLTLNNKTVLFKDLTSIEKAEILNFLPNKCLSVLYSHFKEITESFEDFIIIDENKDFNMDKVSFNLISSNLISFISNIYGLSTASFFEMVYVFVNKMKSDSELFYSLSPIDSKILLNILNADTKEQNDSLKMQHNI